MFLMGGALLTQPDNSVASITRLLEVSRSTLYKHIPELTDGRTGTASSHQTGLVADG